MNFLKNIKSIEFEVIIFQLFIEDITDNIFTDCRTTEVMIFNEGEVTFLNKNWNCSIVDDKIFFENNPYRVDFSIREEKIIKGSLRKKIDNIFGFIGSLIPKKQETCEDNRVYFLFKDKKEQIIEEKNKFDEFEEVQDLLKSIGISESVIETFKEEKIKIKHLKKIINDIYLLKNLGLKYGEIFDLQERMNQ
jgi:hypothetical protein